MATTEAAMNLTDITSGSTDGGVNVPGLVAIILFYLVILGIGLWAAWRRKGEASTEEVMLAGRDIGIFVGILTMTATWVGGGYINGSAEAVFASGLIFCQAPFGYAISLSLGGLFFARKMRDAQYVTMLDPLQNCFGQRWGAMLYLPALAGETLWSASILSALGSTLAVILDINNTLSIIVSAAIAVLYTLFGGLYSVAYTDVVQLFCIFIGLWITVPFAIAHEAVASLAPNVTDWVGSIPADTPWVWGEWADYAVLLICGGIPWQVYFQRVLSARSSKQAQALSFAGSLGCIIMAVPACIIGAIAKATDWEEVGYTKDISKQKKLVLPLVMQYLTPPWVAFLGLGAVSAAVMSSADSSVLSASSMFANNIYKNVFRRSAAEKEVLWVMRVAVIVVAISASAIAIQGNSIYQLFYLCGDLVFVMLFPQLTLAVHFPERVNTYGSIAAYILGFLLRILGGEKVLGVPAVIRYPYYIDGTQYFPFRTLSMIVTMVTLLCVSWLTRLLYDMGYLRDLLDVFSDRSMEVTALPPKPRQDTPKGIDNPAMDMSNGQHRPMEMARF
ncbi:high-affinity choline transporter 1-like [Portunus trituberculatus]|uniref:high-affinity choline transporter 1-like n=1 Tax=Portunus trituberculatus TaxID=210409 RepID=UPI001E1CBB1A|nr:high-affinity choline transporter 1-like [Portunus trituberculatus]XP_045136939.1 high-affinity choline transporter 1-like [Portunus trituberculatus]